jgi:hypothetical protein
MFGYGIGILPLIQHLKQEFPAVKQPWYATDVGAGGPLYGYFPKPMKSILVIRAHNLHVAKATFKDLQFKL